MRAYNTFFIIVISILLIGLAISQSHDTVKLSDEEKRNVLFYLNVFNKGSVFSKNDIDKFLEQLKKEPKKGSFFIESCHSKR